MIMCEMKENDDRSNEEEICLIIQYIRLLILIQ